MKKNFKRGKYHSPEGSRIWEYLTAVICAIGAACMGILMGWNSPSLIELNEPDSRIKITAAEASTLTSCLSIGQVLGLPFSFFFVDWIGRKNSFLLSTLPLMVSWGMILVAEEVLTLIVARILAGFSMGLVLCVSPIYMAEVLSVDIRGSMGSMGAITFFCGILFMFGVAPHLGIQAMACVCLSLTIIFVICIWLIPESPYFLMMVGRADEAESTLEKLRGKTDVADELELIKATLREKGKSLLKRDESGKEESTRKQSALKQLFTIRGNLKALFIGLFLTWLQHMCGLSAILSYCHIILEAVGSGLDVYVASLIFGGLQTLSAIVHVLIVDRVKRRHLLIGSGMIAGFLLSIVAGYFYLIDYQAMDLERYGAIPLCSIFIFVTVINLGIAPLPAIIISEIFATDVKVLASIIIGVCGAGTGIYSTKSYLVLSSSWGLGHSVPLFGYAVTTFICTSILVLLLPETKGKTLLAIQRELNA